MTSPTPPSSAPSEGAAPLGRHRAALVLSWVVIGALELSFAAHSASPPALAWAGAELGLLTLFGILHAALTRGGWQGALSWPGALAVIALLARAELLLPWARVASVVLGLPIAAVLARVVHDIGRRLPLWVMVPALALVFSLPIRLIPLGNGRVAKPRAQLLEDLKAPVLALQPAPRTASGPPVVVLTVDTLRADYASKMSSFERMSARGVSWTHAMSTASWTVPAVASIWTGLMPAEHGAGKRPHGGFSSIGRKNKTIVQELQGRGYRTAAFVVNPFVASSLGFRRGFDLWLNPDEQVHQPFALLGDVRSRPGRDGAQVIDHALRWLDDAPPRGWLLWVHLFDTHLPYTHLPEGHPAAEVKLPGPVRSGELPATPALRKAIREGYGIEVNAVDVQVHRLLDALEARGFFEDGTLVFTSDHGEEFWEHRGYEHGHSHHREVTEIPLVLISPGVSPARGDGIASLIDIAPTLRAVTGSQPGPGEGRDLRQTIERERIAKAAGNLYGAPQTSARTHQHKCIETRTAEATKTVAYHLWVDANEHRKLPADQAPEVCAAASLLRDVGETGEAKADVSTELLCALGYVDCGTGSAPGGAPAPAPTAGDEAPEAPAPHEAPAAPGDDG
jgi:arylsulfatase A-like enzyme